MVSQFSNLVTKNSAVRQFEFNDDLKTFVVMGTGPVMMGTAPEIGRLAGALPMLVRAIRTSAVLAFLVGMVVSFIPSVYRYKNSSAYLRRKQ